MISTRYAAMSPNAVKAGYCGPTGSLALTGPVGEATVSSRARDLTVAAERWKVSGSLTGARWFNRPTLVGQGCA